MAELFVLQESKMKEHSMESLFVTDQMLKATDFLQPRIENEVCLQIGKRYTVELRGCSTFSDGSTVKSYKMKYDHGFRLVDRKGMCFFGELKMVNFGTFKIVVFGHRDMQIRIFGPID